MLGCSEVDLSEPSFIAKCFELYFCLRLDAATSVVSCKVMDGEWSTSCSGVERGPRCPETVKAYSCDATCDSAGRSSAAAGKGDK